MFEKHSSKYADCINAIVIGEHWKLSVYEDYIGCLTFYPGPESHSSYVDIGFATKKEYEDLISLPGRALEFIKGTINNFTPGNINNLFHYYKTTDIKNFSGWHIEKQETGNEKKYIIGKSPVFLTVSEAAFEEFLSLLHETKVFFPEAIKKYS